MQDRFQYWLSSGRHAGFGKLERRLDRKGERDARRLLAKARLVPGRTLLEIGAGHAPIARQALSSGMLTHVIIADISPLVLRDAKRIFAAVGEAHRACMVVADARDLRPFDDETVDVVASRSLLVHVVEKERVFASCFRVLRSDGIAIFCEPINHPFYPEAPGYLWGYDVGPVEDLAQLIREFYAECVNPRTDPFVDFDEWSLINLAEQAGFMDTSMEVLARTFPARPMSWDEFVSAAPNARCPPLKRTMERVLSITESRSLEAHLRPLVEAGGGRRRTAVVYLWAWRERRPV